MYLSSGTIKFQKDKVPEDWVEVPRLQTIKVEVLYVIIDTHIKGMSIKRENKGPFKY